MANEINVEKVVEYNLDIRDLESCLAAGFQPLQGFIIHTKKDGKYWVYDEEEDWYDEL